MTRGMRRRMKSTLFNFEFLCILFKLYSCNVFYLSMAVKVQMNILMMRMPAGKFEEQLQSA